MDYSNGSILFDAIIYNNKNTFLYLILYNPKTYINLYKFKIYLFSNMVFINYYTAPSHRIVINVD
jgi:hypothetical protein